MPAPRPRARRDWDVALCGARTRGTGAPCKHVQGFRTDHVGTGCCWLHGGSTESHKRFAIATEAKRRMVTFGTPIEDIDAPRALLGLLRATAGHVEFLRLTIADMGDLSTREADVVTRLYTEEREMMRRIAESCSRAGVDAAIIRVEEARAAQIMEAMRSVFDDLKLSPGQQAAVGPALRRAAARMGGEAPPPDNDEKIARALASERVPVEWYEVTEAEPDTAPDAAGQQ
jgi:hypothetical protein